MKKQPTSSHRWYVYAYVDPRPEKEGDFIYVGKGTHEGGSRLRRMESHWIAKSLGNPLFSRVLAKIRGLGLEPIRTVLSWHKSENAAFAAEKRSIAEHGLKRDGGTLCNLTFGGEGSAGLRHTKKSKTKIFEAHSSPEAKARTSKTSKERWADPAFKAMNTELIRAAKSTPEARKRVADKGREIWASAEKRAALSAKMAAMWEDPVRREAMLAERALNRAKKSGMFHTASGIVQ